MKTVLNMPRLFLEPCPFCGVAPKAKLSHRNAFVIYTIACTARTCEVRPRIVKRSLEENAIQIAGIATEAWNKRSTHDY